MLMRISSIFTQESAVGFAITKTIENKRIFAQDASIADISSAIFYFIVAKTVFVQIEFIFAGGTFVTGSFLLSASSKNSS